MGSIVRVEYRGIYRELQGGESANVATKSRARRDGETKRSEWIDKGRRITKWCSEVERPKRERLVVWKCASDLLCNPGRRCRLCLSSYAPPRSWTSNRFPNVNLLCAHKN